MDLSLYHEIAASRRHMTTTDTIDSMEFNMRYPSIPTMAVGGLLPHQIDDAARMLHILETKGRAANTSPPGRGKTYVASHCVKHIGDPVMVFCPKAAMDTWKKVLGPWGVPIVTITNYEMAKSTRASPNCKWYDMRLEDDPKVSICPWITKSIIKGVLGKKDNIQYTWNIPYRCTIIFDESHVGKNMGTQTFSFIDGAVKAAKKDGHKIMYLSATPIEKNVNMKSILYFLGVTTSLNLNAVNAFFKQRLGSSSMEDIHEYLYRVTPDNPKTDTGCMSYMSEEGDIPEGVVNDVKPVAYPMNDEITKKIAETNREIIILRDRLRTKDYEGTLGKINTNRRFIELYKVEKAAELAAAALRGEFPYEEGFKHYKRVAIFVNFKESLYELEKHLSKKTYIEDGKEISLNGRISLLHGDQTRKGESTRNIDMYMNGTTKILLATIMKGGVSLSFHDTIGDKETLTIIMPPTSATQIYQTLGRHYRTSVRSSVTQVILFSLGDPVEESIRKALSTKLDSMLKFTTGSGAKFDLYDLVDQRLVEEIVAPAA